MLESIEKIFLAGLGAASLTKEKIDRLLDDLVEKGELSRDKKTHLMEELLSYTEKRRDELRELINTEVKKILRRLEIPTREEVEALQKQIDKHIKNHK